MARFYADEQFPRLITLSLRELGHDVLTVQEAGQANQKISDPAVLAFASRDRRAVLTMNRIDFIKLHRSNSDHGGIIACTENPDFKRLATKIDEAIANLATLDAQLIRIYRDG
jgi:predicted nuclease of predicted toxin-antitoxin system